MSNITQDFAISVLQGLPGSGKSAHAEQWLAGDPKRRVVVNRDRIRFHLYRQYSDLSRIQEDLVTGVEFRLADLALRQRKSVMVDNTNRRQVYVDQWMQLADNHGVPCAVITIGTPLSECLRRNRARAAAGGRFVPEDVIHAMSRTAQWVTDPDRSGKIA
ncbi:AAA family ATPase [Mycobacterium sp. NPDC003449]